MTFPASTECWEWYLHFTDVQRKQKHKTDRPLVHRKMNRDLHGPVMWVLF